ncbi:alpha-amylase family glycosyl hydrolase [Mucilaginibacter lacusdianchii]|uniref:alpha-amylase family glycosyl hydrolase n=1 Tax=Mucilaginibacter lacusdianchii TaxID=2684211 RepID=UPI00131E6A47|nr:alpha-amylase family glycosyl hydrolase [Mucilaginibacter sp. JXJ CY 39]
MKFITRRYLLKVLLFFAVSIFSFCKKDKNQAAESPYSQYGTPYASVPATQDAIIYQVNIRAFSNDANLKGVTARLDSIKALGVNVVYLMPTYPVGVLKSAGGLGSPYAVKDYKAVNPEFGTLDDLRALVDAAHAKGMAVMLDWVANHTSWDNAWIAEHKDWYKQQNGNIVSPANYSDVAQLDFTNQAMRSAMIDAMQYWVYTTNIDGYRCDFADNVPMDFWKQAIDALRGITTHKLIMLAEGTRSDHSKAGFDLVYGMSYYSTLSSKVFANAGTVTQLQNENVSEYASILPVTQVLRYITNHDVYSSDGSPVNLYGGRTGSMSAFLVTAYMKGVPMIYNGQEVGTTRDLNIFYHNPIDWTTNPDMTAEYKKILNFRKSSDAVKNGQLSMFSSDDVTVFTKSTEVQKVLVIANLRNRAVTYTMPSTITTTGWKNAFTNTSITLNNQVYLQPYQHMVLVQ